MKTRIRLSVVTNSFCSADDRFVPWSKEKPGKRRSRAKAYLFNRRKVAMIRNATSKTSASPHGAAGRSSKHKLISVPVPGYVQAGAEASMRDLRTQLPDDLLEAYIPALAEKYVYMIKPDPVIPSKGDTADQLSKVKKH